MGRTYAFLPVTAYAKSIEIEDIGHCALRGTSVTGAEYYLIINSIRGKTLRFQYGPIAISKPDAVIPVTPSKFSFGIYSFDAQQIDKYIQDFLENNALDNVDIITPEDVKEVCTEDFISKLEFLNYGI